MDSEGYRKWHRQAHYIMRFFRACVLVSISYTYLMNISSAQQNLFPYSLTTYCSISNSTITIYQNSVVRADLPIVYVYDHCPFCVRVRLAMGVKNVKHLIHFLANDDIATPTSLVGKKIAPIFVSYHYLIIFWFGEIDIHVLQHDFYMHRYTFLTSHCTFTTFTNNFLTTGNP